MPVPVPSNTVANRDCGDGGLVSASGCGVRASGALWIGYSSNACVARVEYVRGGKASREVIPQGSRVDRNTESGCLYSLTSENAVRMLFVVTSAGGILELQG